MSNPKFRMRMWFEDADELRTVIKAHRLRDRRDIVFVKNDKARIRAVCNGKTCSWSLYACYI